MICSSFVPLGTIVLWIKNLSLHTKSEGTAFCACIVTVKKIISKSVASKFQHHIQESWRIKIIFIPVKEHVKFGLMIPVCGLTQYFFADVVLTCQKIYFRWIMINLMLSVIKSLEIRLRLDVGNKVRTLKATWWSDLFVSRIQHELCFWNSTNVKWRIRTLWVSTFLYKKLKL